MFRALVLSFVTIIIPCNSSKELDIWKVYYFGGQSNTDGFIKMDIAFAKALKQLEGNCLENN